ncbi:hypothetical protein WJX74_002071 [Apatococcus lobatus]|uniref:Guanylate cyclase domain-containing protein n=1 Tax=Apatococcus lobatus TaxID=904363 RepID=A0AAW1QW29_9CHLO
MLAALIGTVGARPAPPVRSSFVGAATKISHIMRHASNASSSMADIEGQMADRATSSTPLVTAPSTDRPLVPPAGGNAKTAVILPVVDRILLVDMGVHLMVTMKDPETLIQLGVPGLELRMLFHKSLRTQQCVSAGYFEAPAAATSSVAFNRHGASRVSTSQEVTVSMPDVVICFCAIDGLQAMQAANAEATEGAVKVYLLVLRQLLIITHGYECQQADGCLMLAFSKSVDAAEFCLMAQACLCAHAWGPSVEGLPGCGPETIQGPAKTSVTVSGPRAKMGLVMGQPTRVCPHTTSGRADYFGPLVNRAARICHAAAHGRQVLASEIFMERLLLDWTGQAEHPAQGHGTSRLSMSSIERPSTGTSQLCALHGVSKSWQDRSEQAWSSIASMTSMGNPGGAVPQPGPGPQIELAATRRSHGDLEMQVVSKSLVLSSQDTLHSILSCSQVLLHHQGDMLFKGVNQRMAIYQLTNPLLWREVSQEATSRKATFLSAGRGLAAILTTSVPLPPDSPQTTHEHESLPQLIAALRPTRTSRELDDLSEAPLEGGLHGLLARFRSEAIQIEDNIL